MHILSYRDSVLVFLTFRFNVLAGMLAVVIEIVTKQTLNKQCAELFNILDL